jgi:hypothetical protein
MEPIIPIDSNNDKTVKKAQRTRNSSYPSFTIENCVKFTTRIDSEFSNINYTPAKDISETIGLSGGAFLQQLSSCVQYGLLELKAGDGYKSTHRFEKIKKPLPSENVNDTLIECFQEPALYKRLINDLREKQLPSEKGLANTLDRTYGVKGNAANVAAKVFLKNVQALGLLGTGNVLKLDNAYIPFEETSEEDTEEIPQVINEQPKLLAASTDQKPQVESKQQVQNLNTREIPVFLQGDKREARLVLPIDFTEDDLKRVVKVLSAYLT